MPSLANLALQRNVAKEEEVECYSLDCCMAASLPTVSAALYATQKLLIPYIFLLNLSPFFSCSYVRETGYVFLQKSPVMFMKEDLAVQMCFRTPENSRSKLYFPRKAAWGHSCINEYSQLWQGSGCSLCKLCRIF